MEPRLNSETERWDDPEEEFWLEEDGLDVDDGPPEEDDLDDIDDDEDDDDIDYEREPDDADRL